MSSFLKSMSTVVFLLAAIYFQIFFNFFFTSPFLKIFPTLMVVFIIGSRKSSFSALWIGAIVGLCIDSFSHSYSGFDTFLYAFFGAMSGLLSGDNTNIKVEGAQRVPYFLLLFNLFLFAKALLISNSQIDLLSWVLSALSVYLFDFAPANLLTIPLFIIIFTLTNNER